MEMLQLNTDISQCLLNCSNNGKCAYNPAKNSFICDCIQNYTGSLCQIDKRPCNSNKLQCMNNGECINTNNDYNFTCNCSYPFYGNRCQFKQNICQNMKCTNQGICKIINNTIPTCYCFPGYFGDNCEISSAKVKIIKATGYAAVGVSIAFFVCLFSLIIYIDIARSLRKDDKPKKIKKKETIQPVKIEQINQAKNRKKRLETIAEEN
jgi:hypothetical protein